MNPWPFVIASYLATALGTIGLVWASLAAMRQAEARAESLSRERPGHDL
jgi:Flp pilus assembly protein CpaB